MILATADSNSTFWVLAFFALVIWGMKKAFSSIHPDIKGAAKDAIIDRIGRWRK